MSMCENCKSHEEEKDPKFIPFVAHDKDMARLERTIKRLWILLLVLIALLAGSNAAWIYYESQFQYDMTSTEIEQDTDGGGNNYVVGGDFNGETKDQNNKENTNP